MVGQRERLDVDPLAAERERLGGMALRRGVAGVEGVERFQLVSVEHDPHAVPSVKEPVEDEADVSGGVGELFREVLLRRPGRAPGEAIEFLPQDERAVGGQTICPANALRALRQLDKPPVPSLHEVEIPHRARQHAFAASRDRQPSTLRERRGLQTQSEPAQVRFVSLVAWTPAARTHRFQQVRLRHSRAVVENADRRRLGLRVGQDVDPPGPRSEGVVDHVGDRGLQRVAHVTQALDQNRGSGRHFLFLHRCRSPLLPAWRRAPVRQTSKEQHAVGAITAIRRTCDRVVPAHSRWRRRSDGRERAAPHCRPGRTVRSGDRRRSSCPGTSAAGLPPAR